MNIDDIDFFEDKMPIDDQIDKLIDFIEDKYGVITPSDCNELLNKSPKLFIKIGEYLRKHPQIYGSGKEKVVLNSNLQNLLDSYFYLKGIEEIEQLEIDENYDLNEEFLSTKYDSAKIYMNSINFPVLTAEEEQELVARMKQGDKSARDWLIKCNLRLVVSIVSQIIRKKGELIPFMDMVEEGNYGLIYAIDKYDPSRGTKISTYVTNWIVNKISYAIDSQAKQVERPIYFNEAYKKYQQILSLMSYIIGRDATKKEIAQLFGVSMASLDKLESMKNSIISMDSPVNDEEETTFGELVADDTNEPTEQQYENKYLKEELERILETLPDREKKIIYGIFFENKNLTVLAEEFNLTRERIRQICSQELIKLSRKKEVRKLSEFILDEDLTKKPRPPKSSFGIRKFNKKEKNKKINSEVSIMSLYDKMKIIYSDLKSGKYTYEDLVIEDSKTKKKTIN